MSGMVIATTLPLYQSAPWQLVCLWGVLLGTGSGLVANVMEITVVTRWFQRQRGLLLGILSASTAAGQLLFLPPLSTVVEADGWRCAVYLEAVALGLLVPLVIFFMRDAPTAKKSAQVGGVGRFRPLQEMAQANPIAETLLAPRQGIGSTAFWVLCTSFFICGATSAGLVGTHFIPACSDHGA
jgi:sugar phosphate permease